MTEQPFLLPQILFETRCEQITELLLVLSLVKQKIIYLTNMTEILTLEHEIKKTQKPTSRQKIEVSEVDTENIEVKEIYIEKVVKEK